MKRIETEFSAGGAAKGRRGFTLLELLVVIGIIALLSAMTISGYFGATQGMARNKGQSQIRDVLLQARQQACMLGIRSAVIFSEGSIYAVYSEVGVLSQIDGQYCDPFWAVYDRLKMYGPDRPIPAVNLQTGVRCTVSYIKNPHAGIEEVYLFRGVSGSGDEVPLGVKSSQDYNLPRGYTVPESTKVVFRPDGSLESGGSITVANPKKESLGFSVTIGNDGKVSLK